MFCKRCGTRLNETDMLCPKCGITVSKSTIGNGFWDLFDESRLKEYEKENPVYNTESQIESSSDYQNGHFNDVFKILLSPVSLILGLLFFLVGIYMILQANKKSENAEMMINRYRTESTRFDYQREEENNKTNSTTISSEKESNSNETTPASQDESTTSSSTTKKKQTKSTKKNTSNSTSETSSSTNASSSSGTESSSSSDTGNNSHSDTKTGSPSFTESF